MNQLLLWTGRLAGLIGLLAVGCAVLLRASGLWYVANFQLGTLLQGGIAAMVLGAWAYAASIAERTRVGQG